MIRITTAAAFEAIADRATFTTSGALSGRTPHGDTFTSWEAGRAPHEQIDSFRSATYAVFSYATPIAWVVDGRWVIPTTRYSLTTSRHQSTARHGAQLSGLDVSSEVAA